MIILFQSPCSTSLCLFSLGSCFANFITFYVYPSSSVIILFLFLHSLPDQFLHPATHFVLPSCSNFTRLLVPVSYFLLSVCRFYFFCMRCRGLVFACNLEVLLLSWYRAVVTGLYIDSLVLTFFAGQETCILAYWKNRANYSFLEIYIAWMNLRRFSWK